MNTILVISQIAVRNLFSNFLNIVIGLIILIGTLLFVVGGSVLNSIDSAMSRSITGSVAGNIQVYSDKSKDDLALFGSWTTPDLSAISDFSKIKAALQTVDNVKAVIPMGVDSATVTYGNTLDQTLEKLRGSENLELKGDGSKELKDQIESLKSHIRQIVYVIQNDYKKLTVMASKQAVDIESERDLAKAASPEFWKNFDDDPFGSLEFLENRISSLVPDADMIYLPYIGTDLDSFQKSFDRMEIVDGQMVPEGHRGILLSKYQYENQFKLKIAYRLDKINEALTEEGKKISQDPDLQLMIKQNRTQTREIILQLDPLKAQKMMTLLQNELKSNETEMAKLLSGFFDTNDLNFAARYRFFYSEMVPLIDLYRLKPGDTITIKAYTKSGFVQSVNLIIYGTFQFKGLEKSGLAGGVSLMDLMSFRDLYGFVTPEKIAEANQLEQAAGVKFVDREKAESELFTDSSSVSNVKEKKIDDQKELGDAKSNSINQSLLSRRYTKDEIEKGVVLNAAIILKDPTRLDQTMKSIMGISKKNDLNLRVVTWQKAAGEIGQFVFVAKAALYFAVFIIFIVALVIINNAVMMATLQRVHEIGTMRAIGAQRTFVLGLVLIETIFLGLVFGSAGMLLGALFVKWLGIKGIGAFNEFLYFFFSGPRLYVTLELGSLLGAFIIICAVTSISALYPAIIATRVSPLQAMQTEE
ncbi:MAG: ABC transporter permease [Nitrospiria bacterium]